MNWIVSRRNLSRSRNWIMSRRISRRIVSRSRNWIMSRRISRRIVSRRSRMRRRVLCNVIPCSVASLKIYFK